MGVVRSGQSQKWSSQINRFSRFFGVFPNKSWTCCFYIKMKKKRFKNYKWKKIFMTNLLENSSKFEIRYLIKIRSTRLKVIPLLETLIQDSIVLIKSGFQWIWFILQLNLIHGVVVNKQSNIARQMKRWLTNFWINYA